MSCTHFWLVLPTKVACLVGFFFWTIPFVLTRRLALLCAQFRVLLCWTFQHERPSACLGEAKGAYLCRVEVQSDCTDWGHSSRASWDWEPYSSNGVSLVVITISWNTLLKVDTILWTNCFRLSYFSSAFLYSTLKHLEPSVLSSCLCKIVGVRSTGRDQSRCKVWKEVLLHWTSFYRQNRCYTMGLLMPFYSSPAASQPWYGADGVSRAAISRQGKSRAGQGQPFNGKREDRWLAKGFCNCRKIAGKLLSKIISSNLIDFFP